jgi:ketosteroid isomerase-like protein
MRYLLAATVAVSLTMSCSKTLDISGEKQSLIAADIAFSRAAADTGVPQAFDHFMADSATILRDKAHPITGREAIRQLYSGWTDEKLEWEPLFADVSSCGDLGYTIGRYHFSAFDSDSTEITSGGYYVTIWRKQLDGTWKYVFDTGTQGLPE